MYPNAPEASLVSANPGIWKIPNMFDDDILDKLEDAVRRAGDESGLFQRCAGDSHEHLDDKECFRFSPSTATTEEDKALVASIMKEFGTIWPSKQEQRDYLYTQRTHAGCGATELHADVNHEDGSSATTTIVLYLNNGGAGVFFPFSDDAVVIPPERGMVLTWLNTHPDGRHNSAAYHGIQATPMEAPERLALTFRINYSHRERVAAEADFFV